MERHTALIKGKFNTKVGIETEWVYRYWNNGSLEEKDIFQTSLSEEIIEVEIDNPPLEVGNKLYLCEKDIVITVVTVVRTDRENVIMYIVGDLYKDKVSDIYDKFLELKREYDDRIKIKDTKIEDLEENMLSLVQGQDKLKNRTLWQRIFNLDGDE